MVSVLVSAPVMLPVLVNAVAPLYHWYVAPVPVATTLNTALLPVHFVNDTGCVLILTASFTTNVALLDVAAPQGADPLTTTL